MVHSTWLGTAGQAGAVMAPTTCLPVWKPRLLSCTGKRHGLYAYWSFIVAILFTTAVFLNLHADISPLAMLRMLCLPEHRMY